MPEPVPPPTASYTTHPSSAPGTRAAAATVRARERRPRRGWGGSKSGPTYDTPDTLRADRGPRGEATAERLRSSDAGPRPAQHPQPYGGQPQGGYGYPGAQQPQQPYGGQPQGGQPFGGGQPQAPAPTPAPAGDFSPFWFAVPVPRPLFAEDGSPTPIAELAPGTWYLAVEQRGAILVAQTQDGRRGVLQDTSGIQRG
ncbi:hypothetical protein [Streptomyces sp. uw30]|uniref:hypothetical protein n=1 Tax=Streptomyces sp. uw30 TaxID=1828179 RepID=UPI00290595C3|nr:hypothetical protein [Streptomyces sp. uw30]